MTYLNLLNSTILLVYVRLTALKYLLLTHQPFLKQEPKLILITRKITLSNFLQALLQTVALAFFLIVGEDEFLISILYPTLSFTNIYYLEMSC